MLSEKVVLLYSGTSLHENIKIQGLLTPGLQTDVHNQLVFTFRNR